MEGINWFGRSPSVPLRKTRPIKNDPYPDLAKFTINEPLKIPAGEEKIFEGQDITLTADVYARGTLIFRNCVVHGEALLDHYTKADVTISGATFENCPSIHCAGLTDCVFTDCGEIKTEDGAIKDCQFTRVKGISANVEITRCQFSQLRYISEEEEGLISLGDCGLSHCDFDDVELLCGAYLVRIDGYGRVARCAFTNCRTTRSDRQLFYGEQDEGGFLSSVEEYEVADKHTCTGLDKVALLR